MSSGRRSGASVMRGAAAQTRGSRGTTASSFVKGGTIQPNNPQVVTYSTQDFTQRTSQAGANHQETAKTGPVVNTVVEPMSTDQVHQLPIKDENTLSATPSETDADGAVVDKKRPWIKNFKKADGVKRKPNKQLRERRMRKALVPRNAILVLEQVRHGSPCTYSQATPGGPYTAVIMVDGKKYTGTAPNKVAARGAASEMALQALIQPPETTIDEHGREVVEERTPWSALAAFAMHKLMCDWGRGIYNVPTHLPDPAKNGSGGEEGSAVLGAVMSQLAPKMLPQPVVKLKPRALPEDAATRHPVTVLAMVCPSAVYEVVDIRPMARDVEAATTVSVKVQEELFSATARNKKLAKVAAAKSALEKLYGVVYETIDTPAAPDIPMVE